jgi:diaminopimelate epimerase
MKIRFQKLQGAGNDFVVVDNRRGIVRNPGRFARLTCDRHRGIGADGVLLVERSTIASYRMMYYNADGSYGGMCGNGGRCIALFASRNDIASLSHRFEALDHIYTAHVMNGGHVRLAMKDPVDLRAAIRLKGPYGSFSATYVDTGSPHVVLEVPKGRLRRFPLTTVGPWIRTHPMFAPKGTNVNVVERSSASSLRMRTYERGVEAETLACGTGSVACSVSAHLLHGMRSPVTIHTASGDKLKVSFKRTPQGYRDIVLEGPAVISFEGTIDVQTP